MSQLFLGEYQVVANRLLVPVQISARTAKQSQANSPTLTGLIDTGATCSLIRKDIIEKLQLVHIGQGGFARTADGQYHPRQEYFANLIIGDRKQQTLIDCQVFSIDTLSVEMIIGMNIISTWHLDWHGSTGLVKITALTSD